MATVTSKRAQVVVAKQIAECTPEITDGLKSARDYIEWVKGELNNKKRKERKGALDYVRYVLRDIASVEANLAALKAVDPDNYLVESGRQQVENLKSELLALRPTLEDLSDGYDFSTFDRWSRERGEDVRPGQNESEEEDYEVDDTPSDYQLALDYVRTLVFDRKDEEKLVDQLTKLANIISTDLNPSLTLDENYLAAKMKLEEGIIFLNKLNPDNDMVPIFEKKIEVWDKELKKGRWSNFGCLMVFALIVAGYLLYKHL